MDSLATGEPADLVVRPESLRLVAEDHPRSLVGELVERRFTGAQTFLQVEVMLDGEPEPIEIEVLADRDEITTGGPVRVAPRSSGPAPRIFRRRSGDS